MPTFIVVYKMSYRSFLDRLRCRGRKKTKGNMMSMKLSPQEVGLDETLEIEHL